MTVHVAPPDPKSRPGGFMFTFSGIYWPYDPRPEEVRIEDIAHHLAMQCRYAGACVEFYSVAEHSVHCSYIGPQEEALERLMHDAPEFAVQDFIRPHKVQPWCNKPYLEVEDLNARVIAERFKLVYPWPASVKLADETVAQAECAQIIAAAIPNYLVEAGTLAADVKLACWPPAFAKMKFLQRWHELKRVD